MSNIATYFKHSMSVCSDQRFAAEIVWEEKRIEVRIDEFDSDLFINFVRLLEADHGIIAYTDDNEGWQPTRTTWKIMVTMRQLKLIAQVVKLMSSGDANIFTVVLSQP